MMDLSILQIFEQVLPSIILLMCCITFMLPLKRRKYLKIRISVLVGIFIVMGVLSQYFQDEIFKYGINVIIFLYIIIFIYMTCEQTVTTVIYFSVWVITIYQTVWQSWEMIFKWSRVAGVITINQSFIIVWAVIIYIILYFTVICWMANDGKCFVGPRQLTLSLLLLLMYEILFYYAIDNFETVGISKMAVIMFMGELYCLTILYLQNSLFGKSAMHHELETMNILWQQQKEQFYISKESIAFINYKCHDLKHQIAALKSIASTEEYDKHIRELQENVNIYDSVIHTENEALNTVLTEKCMYCERQQIMINCVVDGKKMDFIDPVDLYTIMGNALDNAIESVEKIMDKEKRIIDVLICVKQNFLTISITNPIEQAISFAEDMPISTKKKNGYHGFGLKSIKNTAKKYGGLFSVKVQNGCFSLYILFPLPEEKKANKKVRI